MKNILEQKIKIFDLLFSKPKSGLADLWSRMVAKLRILGSKTFLGMYFNNSNNNLRHVPYGCDGMQTFSLYKATRSNPARPDG